MKKLIISVVLSGVLLSNVVSIGNRALNNIESGRVSEATSEFVHDSIYGFMNAIRGESMDLSFVTDGMGEVVSAIFTPDNSTIYSTRVNGFSPTKTVEGFGN